MRLKVEKEDEENVEIGRARGWELKRVKLEEEERTTKEKKDSEKQK